VAEWCVLLPCAGRNAGAHSEWSRPGKQKEEQKEQKKKVNEQKPFVEIRLQGLRLRFDEFIGQPLFSVRPLGHFPDFSPRITNLYVETIGTGCTRCEDPKQRGPTPGTSSTSTLITVFPSRFTYSSSLQMELLEANKRKTRKAETAMLYFTFNVSSSRTLNFISVVLIFLCGPSSAISKPARRWRIAERKTKLIQFNRVKNTGGALSRCLYQFASRYTRTSFAFYRLAAAHFFRFP